MKIPRHKATRGLRKSKRVGFNRISERVAIHERSSAIDNTQEFGHWERDFISFRKNFQHILVLRERL